LGNNPLQYSVYSSLNLGWLVEQLVSMRFITAN
jgi:hypothetical protein